MPAAYLTGGVGVRRHTLEHVRHQREHYIARRVTLLRRLWGDVGHGTIPAGRFAKWNTSCNCGLCDHQWWPDTRPRTVQAVLDFQEAMSDLRKLP